MISDQLISTNDLTLDSLYYRILTLNEDKSNRQSAASSNILSLMFARVEKEVKIIISLTNQKTIGATDKISGVLKLSTSERAEVVR